jgi:hypothetical protein
MRKIKINEEVRKADPAKGEKGVRELILMAGKKRVVRVVFDCDVVLAEQVKQ